MSIPDFVFLSHKDLPGGEVIFQTKQPFAIARAFKFQSEKELESFMIKYNLHGSVALVPGYNIILCYIGTIEGINELVVLGHNVPIAILPILNQMNFFYEKERINGNESRNKKFARN